MITEDPFVMDLFLACITGLVAADYKPDVIYAMAKDHTQQIYRDHLRDNELIEEMDQTWPTKFS